MRYTSIIQVNGEPHSRKPAPRAWVTATALVPVRAAGPLWALKSQVGGIMGACDFRLAKQVTIAGISSLRRLLSSCTVYLVWASSFNSQAASSSDRGTQCVVSTHRHACTCLATLTRPSCKFRWPGESDAACSAMLRRARRSCSLDRVLIEPIILCSPMGVHKFQFSPNKQKPKTSDIDHHAMTYLNLRQCNVAMFPSFVQWGQRRCISVKASFYLYKHR